MYLVVSLLVLRAGCGIWLYQFLIIAYPFTFLVTRLMYMIKKLQKIQLFAKRTNPGLTFDGRLITPFLLGCMSVLPNRLPMCDGNIIYALFTLKSKYCSEAKGGQIVILPTHNCNKCIIDLTWYRILLTLQASPKAWTKQFIVMLEWG